MRELFKKIFEHIISREEDTYQMDKRLGDCMEEYISRYQGRFSEKDKNVSKTLNIEFI